MSWRDGWYDIKNKRAMDYSNLIRVICERGDYTLDGVQAIRELVKGGEPALDAFLAALKDPHPSPLHGRDLCETHFSVFSAFASNHTAALIDRYQKAGIGEHYLIHALGKGKGIQSIELLIEFLNHKDGVFRWMAAMSLIERRSKRSLKPLIEHLKDRDSLVKSEIIEAMEKSRFFRHPDALPALKRIVASEYVKRTSPGLHDSAARVVALIEEENK